MALSAPISIAATQTAWALALLFGLLRLSVVRPRLAFDPMTVVVLIFVGLTLVSSTFSYEPEVSIRKMVAVSLVSIAYLVFAAIRREKDLRRIVASLLLAAVVTSLYAIGVTVVGRNLKVTEVDPAGMLALAGVRANDTIVSINETAVASPQDLEAALHSIPSDAASKIRVYRLEAYYEYEIPAGAQRSNFGILNWSRGRDVRAAGFYGHYTTFAESLQLAASLAFGLLIAVPYALGWRYRLAFAALVGSLAAALALTLTRASWAGFAISGFVILLLGASKRAVIICVLLAIPVGVAGLVYLQQKRNVALVDANDGSTTWRTTVWSEAVRVIVDNPRHLLVGVGMDSIKTHWQEWRMFDNGRLPIGHMHSTPLQFAFERGIPALIAWIVWIALYFRMLWRAWRRTDVGWPERGVVLGSLGGSVGFLASGLVHYNWGDSEVVMIFYLLTGLNIWIARRAEAVGV